MLALFLKKKKKIKLFGSFFSYFFQAFWLSKGVWVVGLVEQGFTSGPLVEQETQKIVAQPQLHSLLWLGELIPKLVLFVIFFLSPFSCSLLPGLLSMTTPSYLLCVAIAEFEQVGT